VDWLADSEQVIVVNFKTYPESSGAKAVALARTCQSVAQETNVKIMVAPPMPDLALVARSVEIPVFSQHIDDVKAGSTTGHVALENVVASGAKGTLLNHSERRLRISEIASIVSKARREQLTTVVCTNDLAVTRACAALEPDFVAIEPPELIGGDVSVTSANPDIVAESVRVAKAAYPGVKVLCGAGVKTGDDVAKAIELGTNGVLLASGVTKASDPRRALLGLVSGLGR
jgi:triosephosphate isomerase